MKFITDQENFHSKTNGHDIYTLVEISGASQAEVLKTFIRQEIRPHDMDGSYETTFHVRFEDDACYKVFYEASWAGEDEDTEIRDFVEIFPLRQEECPIQERPGAFTTERRVLDDASKLPVHADEEVVGVYIASPPVKHDRHVFRSGSACLPLIRQEGAEPSVKLYISTFHGSLVLPLAVLMEGGCKVSLLLKVSGPSVEGEYPSP